LEKKIIFEDDLGDRAGIGGWDLEGKEVFGCCAWIRGAVSGVERGGEGRLPVIFLRERGVRISASVASFTGFSSHGVPDVARRPPSSCSTLGSY
jgi:hypothetical protein